MLKRKIERKLIAWIKKSSKALLLYGARQVGKTYIIRKVLTQQKCEFVEFNLVKNPEIARLLRNVNSIDELVTSLSLFTSEPFIPHKTFIFLDEIQEYPEIITKIKFFVEDGRYKIIMSGSLLGVEIKNLSSAPVGYLESYTMYPLDFMEFTQLFNINESIINLLEKCYINKEIVPDEINQRMLSIFNLYLIVGGMPEAVVAYYKTKNLEDIMSIHMQIVNQYKLDFTKYEEQNKRLKLINTYELIPSELNEKNKRFNIKSLQEGVSFNRTQDNFIWLKKAGVAIPAYNTTEPVFPLIINEKMNLFKLFLSDVGLLTTLFGNATKVKILSQSESINNGALYENVVAQELNSHGYKCYYYNSKKQGEVDFIIEHNSRILPIEVKSGKDYYVHSALNNLIAKYDIDEAIVLANTNVKKNGQIIYLPIYMIMFVEEQRIENMVLPYFDMRDILV